MRKNSKLNQKKKETLFNPDFKKKITNLLNEIQESVSSFYEEAIKDEKTGVYNHKFFQTILEMEIEKAKRGKQKLSLMMMDIDDFKKTNEIYGHFKADELLFQLGSLMKKYIRKSDILAKFGGEEFLLLLPETEINKAEKLASRLIKEINSDKVLKKHNVTISIGVTFFKKEDTEKKFKERANKALKKAKKEGKNRYVILK